jgi:hypothetical protein
MPLCPFGIPGEISRWTHGLLTPRLRQLRRARRLCCGGAGEREDAVAAVGAVLQDAAADPRAPACGYGAVGARSGRG